MNGLGERNERPFLTLSQAAKRVGKSKATISKAIANGRLSVAKRDSNGFKIDPAELFRVFTPVCSVNGQTERKERASERGERPQVNTPMDPEKEILKARLQAAEQRATDLERLVSDYRRIVDKLLLPGPVQVNETPQETKPRKKRSWWRWYFKGEE